MSSWWQGKMLQVAVNVEAHGPEGCLDENGLGRRTRAGDNQGHARVGRGQRAAGAETSSGDIRDDERNEGQVGAGWGGEGGEGSSKKCDAEGRQEGGAVCSGGGCGWVWAGWRTILRRDYSATTAVAARVADGSAVAVRWQCSVWRMADGRQTKGGRRGWQNVNVPAGINSKSHSLTKAGELGRKCMQCAVLCPLDVFHRSRYM